MVHNGLNLDSTLTEVAREAGMQEYELLSFLNLPTSTNTDMTLGEADFDLAVIGLLFAPEID